MKKNLILIAALVLCAGVAAYHRMDARAEVPAAVQAPVAAAAVEAAAPLTAPRKPAKEGSTLDYAAMEDSYRNDSNAQWAASAAASTSYGQSRGKVSEFSVANLATGPVDGRTWQNDQQEQLCQDWLELGFENAVNATEVRVVFALNKGVEAVSKLELQDTEGHWHTVWSGKSDVKRDERGGRTWFVKAFEPTSYKAQALKITLANTVQSGFKEVDAAQLVGH